MAHDTEHTSVVPDEMKKVVPLPEFGFPMPKYIYGSTGMTYEQTKELFRKVAEQEAEGQEA